VLEKRIPVGAGLGGGSSDAARTLLGLERLRREWLTTLATAGAKDGGVQVDSEKRRPANDLSAFAGRFGSDVPFFVRASFPAPVGGPSAVCTGRGEVVTPVAPPAARWAVLVLPEMSLSTPDVYRRFDEMGLGRWADVDTAGAPDWSEWSRLTAQELLPRLVNDLEAPAFSLRPGLADLRAAVEQALGRAVRMSGSGSSLFTLFDSRADADAAAVRLRQTLRVRAEAIALAPSIEDDLAVNEVGKPL
jgi:4-diphosphocytidyl-2C-methyl-D-erythritol kinase